MPHLDMSVSKEKFYLPSTEHADNEEDRAWVVLDTSPSRGVDTEIYQAGDTVGTTAIKGLARRILEWNYTDIDGKRLPIGYDTVRYLLTDDRIFLQNKIDEANASKPMRLEDSEKKASSPTSSQPEKAKDQPTADQLPTTASGGDA